MAQELAGSQFWTTDFALAEVANLMSAVRTRRQVADLLRALEQSPDTTIIRSTPDLFERALSMYEQYDDKDWSLTDCLSFVVMREHTLTEALTHDHHFAQAGFLPLFRENAS